MSDDEGWPAFLRRAMDRVGIDSGADLARRSGVSEAVISRWLRGGPQPDIPNLRRITEPLKVPLLRLMVEAGHVTADEAKIKAVPLPAVHRADEITRDLNEDQERQLREYAEFMRSQNTSVKRGRRG